MKMIAGIMALIVLLLTVQPVVGHFETHKNSEDTECSATCCGSEAELPTEDDDQSGDPCSDFCNPFLKCGACAASTIEFLAFSIENPAQNLSRYILTTQRVYSQFAPDFWQPPKLA